MGTAADLVRAGSSRHVLVIGAEKLSDWLDWDDRSTAIIFADAAGATVVGPAVAEDAIGIGPVAWGSAGDMANAIEIRDDQGRSRGRRPLPGGPGRVPVGHHAGRPGRAAGRRAGRALPRRHRRVRAAPGQPAHRRGGGAATAEEGRASGHGRRRRHRDSGNTSSASIPMALDHLRAAGRPAAATWCCSSASAQASPTRPRSSSFPKIRQQTPSRRRNHRG